jgi:hypothetical protein
VRLFQAPVVQRPELLVIDPEVVAKLLAADGPDEHRYPELGPKFAYR